MVALNEFPLCNSESLKNVRAARAVLSRQEAAHDATLVTRFNAGDETAFGEIVVRHRWRLAAIAFGVLKNHFDAEEVAQDAFIRAHRCLAVFRGDCSLLSWLHCIALNLARNRYWYFYRRCRHTTFSLDYRFAEDREGTCADFVATEEAGPARQVAVREFSEVVATCMAQLDAPHREILNLRITLDRSYDQISKKLGVPVGTVKSRVARARRTLRERLAHTCPEFGRNALPAAWFEENRPASSAMMIGA